MYIIRDALIRHFFPNTITSNQNKIIFNIDILFLNLYKFFYIWKRSDNHLFCRQVRLFVLQIPNRSRKVQIAIDPSITHPASGGLNAGQLFLIFRFVILTQGLGLLVLQPQKPTSPVFKMDRESPAFAQMISCSEISTTLAVHPA